MTKRTYIGVLTVALAVVLAAGGLLASNMGFKLNYPLVQTAAGVSASGTSTIALPDNRQAGGRQVPGIFRPGARLAACGVRCGCSAAFQYNAHAPLHR